VAFRKVPRIRFKLGRQKYVRLEAGKKGWQNIVNYFSTSQNDEYCVMEWKRVKINDVKSMFLKGWAYHEDARWVRGRLLCHGDVSFQGAHYNNRGLFCDPNIIANTKERSFRKPAVANHNSSQTLKLLWYHNIHTRTITSPSQLSNSIQLQNFSDCNCFYALFAINNASKTICNKPIIAMT